MDIILKPIITEKMTATGEKLDRYGFFVQKKANKLQIKKAVEELYGVEVKEVNTMNYAGKDKITLYPFGGVTRAGQLHLKSDSYIS